jgi:pimeloyl-ACP methyl ester carboxylesterase
MTGNDDNEGWSRFDYGAPDGLQLAGRKYGFANTSAHGALPVICLSGLTRNASDFHDLAMHLANDPVRKRPVLALDYRGRGMSARDRNWQNYNVLTEAEDVIAGATAAGIGEAVIVGTSRGALISMVLAAMRPALLAGVVMNDAGPEIDGRGLVRIRTYVEKGSDFANWSQAVAAVKAIGRTHFPNWDDAMWARQARRIYAEENGKVVRRYDPALMKTLSAIDLDHPLPAMWPQFEGLANVPVLVVRGANSDLLSEQTLAKMHARHASMESVIVPDQGHAPDLGTEGLPARIASFMARIEAKRVKARRAGS